jgi:predicted O-methyltransferase YrrM
MAPKRIIEVGSGHSSALMLDTIEHAEGLDVHTTFIEPFPARLHSVLRDQDRRTSTIIERRVQDVPLATFETLEADDILFIDSSHVSKVGSDLNYLVFDVLPRLAEGVVVHVHDIFWPFEYPLEWIRAGRAWNEIYLLRAFLQYNEAFDVTLFNHYVGEKHAAFFEAHMPLFLENTGGSLWLRKTTAAA